jgi:hypothetical protein
MTPEYFREIQEAIREEGLDGWLFCNFHHRDPLSDSILGIDPAAANSRLWVYAIPASGGAAGIVHSIECDILGPDLPGERAHYQGREELLAQLAALPGKRWGCNFSDDITAVSFLDAGTFALFGRAGLLPVSSQGLLQRFKGLLKPAGMESHERAARQLYDIAGIAWETVRMAFTGQRSLYEGDIQRLMLDEFRRRDLVCDHPPIVAAGVNSANPHYEITHNGAKIAPGDILQFDLWAKEAESGGIYADISWVGVFAETAPPEIERCFADLLRVREQTLRFIAEGLRAGRRLSGADVDRKAREIICGLGYSGAIRHRTGHGIDTEVHGSGVNMDSVEFPDVRPILEGSCFSLEPGIYLGQFGMRTEIDVYITDGMPVVSGGERQFSLLRCQGAAN